MPHGEETPDTALPRATDGFSWSTREWGPVLQCRPLAQVADHVFTTRHLPLEHPDTDGPGWRRLAAAMAVSEDALRRTRQVHGTAVAYVRSGAPCLGDRPEADVVVTDDPAVAPTVQVADCVPLLLADRRTGVVAAVHAGWRGTAAGVAGASVDAMRLRFGVHPADVVAAVGPAIGPCCYEVGEDVRESFRRAGHGERWLARWFATGPRGRPHLDLWRATVDQLEWAGLRSGDIHVSGLCTATHRQAFYSYRADGPRTGRLAAVIRMLTPRGRDVRSRSAEPL